MLRFARDRRRWRHWLYVATRRFGTSVLNYVVTSNHIHLLVLDRGREEVPATMQLVAGRTAQEFNTRKGRRGAFWEDRYHATAVQDDGHFARCMTYIDLNMVRAGVVTNPSAWEVCGFNEIQSPWGRKGVIDFAELRRLFDVRTTQQLATLLRNAADAEAGNSRRNDVWTSPIGVGDFAFLAKLRSDLGPRGLHRTLAVDEGQQLLRDETSPYSPDNAPKNAN